MNTPKKCLVMLSHSSYSDIWDLTMSSYAKFFEEKDSFDFYVTTDALSETAQEILDKYNFKAIIYNKNISWGQSLLEVMDYLKKRNYNLFLFSFDDLVLIKPTNNQVNDSIQFMLHNNVNYLKVENSLKSLYINRDNSSYFGINTNNSYRGSLVFSIVDVKFVDFLIQMQGLKSLNAWEYEYKVNECIPENIKCYSVRNSLIKYANTIIKGKLDPIQIRIAQQIVKQSYSGSRKTFTTVEVLRFYFKTTLFRVFMYLLPHSLFYKLRSFKKQVINNAK